jgi:hypothetical protein
MARVVESVEAEYRDAMQWEKVVTRELKGAMRYGDLSKALGRPAPVPSIFIDGTLVFDTTPGPEELREYLDRRIKKPA